MVVPPAVQGPAEISACMLRRGAHGPLKCLKFDFKNVRSSYFYLWEVSDFNMMLRPMRCANASSNINFLFFFFVDLCVLSCFIFV